MPGLDGADVIYRLRDDPGLKHIPVVFHTATVRKQELEAHGGLISGYPFSPSQRRQRCSSRAWSSI